MYTTLFSSLLGKLLNSLSLRCVLWQAMPSGVWQVQCSSSSSNPSALIWVHRFLVEFRQNAFCIVFLSCVKFSSLMISFASREMGASSHQLAPQPLYPHQPHPTPHQGSVSGSCAQVHFVNLFYFLFHCSCWYSCQCHISVSGLTAWPALTAFCYAAPSSTAQSVRSCFSLPVVCATLAHSHSLFNQLKSNFF